MAQRIQRKRTKGWKMPPNTVYVGRPTKWGNPFRVERDGGAEKLPWMVIDCASGSVVARWEVQAEAHRSAVRLYRAYLANDGTQPGTCRDAGGWFLGVLAREELRGKDLACFCPCGLPCHADVLLELANTPHAQQAGGGE